MLNTNYFDFIYSNELRLHLDISNKITLVTGDSGTGKSFIASILRNKRATDSGVIVCADDYAIDALLNRIAQACDKLIIIDRYDVLVSSDVEHRLPFAIGKDMKNKFIIFGRNGDYLPIINSNLKQVNFDRANGLITFTPFL